MRAVVMSFRGAEYRIPAHRAFEIGEQIEDIATLVEIYAWAKAPKFFKIARCFGAMLRFAGCEVTDEEVHADLMKDILAAEKGGRGLVAASAVSALMAVLMDGAPRAEEDGVGSAEKKPSAS